MKSTTWSSEEKTRREQFLHGLNSDFEALKKDAAAHKEYQKELEEWDAVLLDGLEDCDQFD